MYRDEGRHKPLRLRYRSNQPAHIRRLMVLDPVGCAVYIYAVSVPVYRHGVVASL